MTCKPNDHNPRYDGAGTYRCGECGARFILVDAIEQACEVIEQLDVVPITIGGTATEEYET